MNATQIPNQLIIHSLSKTLELVYAETRHTLTAEFLRVHSPSAEVRQHGQPILQTGKQEVGLVKAELVGHYGTRLQFDDGHNTGIYTWQYLHDLCIKQDTYWSLYLKQLAAAHASRDPHVQVVRSFK